MRRTSRTPPTLPDVDLRATAPDPCTKHLGAEPVRCGAQLWQLLERAAKGPADNQWRRPAGYLSIPELVDDLLTQGRIRPFVRGAKQGLGPTERTWRALIDGSAKGSLHHLRATVDAQGLRLCLLTESPGLCTQAIASR